jgi:hypothetical protein
MKGVIDLELLGVFMKKSSIQTLQNHIHQGKKNTHSSSASNVIAGDSGIQNETMLVDESISAPGVESNKFLVSVGQFQ